MADEPVKLGSLAEEAAKLLAAPAISPKFVSDLLLIGEGFVIILAALSAILLGGSAIDGSAMWPYAVLGLSGSIAGVSAIFVFGGYEISMIRKGLAQFAPVAAGWTAAAAALVTGLFLTRQNEDVPLWWMTLWYTSGLLALLTVRLVLGRWVSHWSKTGRMERRAVIVGGGTAAEKVIRSLKADDGGIRICGIFDDRSGRRSAVDIAGYPKLGNVRELVEFARQVQVDLLIVAIPLSARERVLELLKSLWVLPLDIRLVGQHLSDPASTGRTDTSFVHVFDKPIGDWGRVAKRLFDLGIAAIALMVFAPLFAMAALAIKLDSKGPVFFKQKRHGFNNQVIDVLKFRSMFHERSDPAARNVVTKGDPRVTRIGRFLRKSSIDELPQLWNVIRGDLSLVGPRPHAVHALSSRHETFNDIVDDYFGRHRVKPGITGWAQINGFRGEIDQPEKLKSRVDHDLHYIENWSILLDIKILAKTPLSLLNTSNAY